MKVNPFSAGPAAALALGVLLPSALPKRRLLSVALVGGAYAATIVQDPSSPRAFTVSTKGLPIPPAQEQLAKIALPSLIVGLASVPVIGLARLLPLGRVPAALALGGAYVAAESYLADKGQQAVAKVDLSNEPESIG
ncbi:MULTISPECIES: hypothetical protein [Allobranchiibius]|uniref:Uncharacterized protein n=1 Tax=Allobranchiibius huperziae TaxID=1874116 RepID=A0A853DLD7_9MICO|nr:MULTISPECIES: hypothetical protein [Allobranchiibius]MBO1766796.1 hypothetical protein [Allobranchiibius sp. GilTou38]NYJ74955.1 hypothetical protein [Allobranchiibius huperziae]UIJ33685.1 hypothetical protein LVQ62_10965 [Allobranchiibius sp. GilTou73]